MFTKAKHLPTKSIVFMWCSLVFAYFLNYFYSLNTAILQPYLIEEFNTDILTVTNIGSMYFYTYLLMQIPTGIVVDKFGVRKVATIACLTTAIGTCLFAFSSSIELLYIGRAMAGIGNSVVFLCIIKFQLWWIPHRIIMTLTGIACFIGMMGGLFAQVPLVFLVELLGWRMGLVVIAALSFLNAFMTFFIVDKEKDVNNEKNNYAQEKEVQLKDAILSIFKNKHMIPPIIFNAVFSGSYILLIGYYGIGWLEQVYAYDSYEASSIISLGVLGSSIASILIGYWADKINSRKIPVIFCGFIYVLTWAVFVFYAGNLSHNLLLILIFVLGFFSSAYIICWICVQKANPESYSALAVSIYNMGSYLGPIALPLLFAYVFDNASSTDVSTNYQNSFIYIFIIVVLGYLSCFVLKDDNNS